MPSRRSPTFGLLAGLAVTLSAVAVYSSYTVRQLRSVRRLQTETIDRNRTDSLLLLRIQNNLNSLALAHARHAGTASEPYPLTAWQTQFKRIRVDLDDALAREENTVACHRRSAPLSGDVRGSVLGRGGPDFRAGCSGAGRRSAHSHPAVAAGAPGSVEHRGGPVVGAEQ